MTRDSLGVASHGEEREPPAGSRTATVAAMDVIPQKDLRNHVSEVLRRVEAGESVLISVAGRTVAQLSPATRRRWVGGDDLEAVWRAPAPRGMQEDLAGFEAGLTDPFER